MTSRVVLVTGGAVRIGRAVSVEMAEAGWDVLVHYHRSREEAASLAQSLSRKHGVRVETIRADLTSPSSPRRISDHIRKRWGRLDALVNNAGILEQGPVKGLDHRQWDRLMALNLRAPFHLVEALLPLLKKSDQPAVVNVTDIIESWPGHTAYVVSKAALTALTCQLAVELAPHIRVNAVAPGTILFPEHFPAAMRKKILSRIPARRKGEPEEVARTVRFLIEGPAFITGQVIAVDGGRSAAG